MSNIKGKKVALVSLGCDKNLIDSEVMLGLLKKDELVLTNNKKEADILILNTCGFIKDAVEESFENALDLSQYKKNGNCKAFIITGCMAQRYRDEIFEEVPYVDAVLGTGDYENIINAIYKAFGGEKHSSFSDINTDISEEAKQNRVLSTPNHYAYIKIAEGCDKHCTYCAIPSLRGNYRSRKIEDLVKEAENLAKQGVKELVVIAQDTSLYGLDLYGDIKIAELLNKFSLIDGISWIRLLYCYPEHITDELINEMANNDKIVKYIDLPIQHCSDTVLKRMNRKSSKQQIIDMINKLRTNIPNIIIRTTLITGFPAETNSEFLELEKFIKDIKFDKLGVFAYSREEGTPAYNLPNHIKDSIKTQRAESLMLTQQKVSEKLSKTKLNQTLKVLVEGIAEHKTKDKTILYYGRSYMDCPEVDGLVFFEANEGIIIGDFINIKITQASEYDLIGVIVNEA